MTTEQHGSKTERIAELKRKIAELEAANEATPTWGAAVGARWEQIKGLRSELSRLRNEQHDNKAERMAELDNTQSKMRSDGHWRTDRQEAMADAELSRLRNEGGDSKTGEGRGDLVHIRTDRGLWRPNAEGYTNDKRDAGRWLRSEAERMTRHLGPEKCLQLILVDTPSPLAPVEAGRGEREELERIAAYLQSEELMRKWDSWRKMIAEGNTGSYPRDCFEAEMHSLSEEISAALSQGNGEAVGKALNEMGPDDYKDYFE